ncbi:hypothetical protein BC936DRAFT_139074 [Jimgerdemannia flammicorona]|nr:hypothetical protein BC936DRAFT_139074 [Jimgerdemannia flammicorona]
MRGRLAETETRKETWTTAFVAEVLVGSGLKKEDKTNIGTSSSPNPFLSQVDATLTITSQREQQNVWSGFLKDGRLILRGGGWDDVDMRESIVAVLELAETFACTDVIIYLPRNDPDITRLVHDFLYIGFEPVMPGMPLGAGLGGEAKYVRVGMEL